MLSPHGLSGSAAGPEQLFTLLSFLKPGSYEDMRDVLPAHITDPEQQVRTLWDCCGFGRWERALLALSRSVCVSLCVGVICPLIPCVLVYGCSLFCQAAHLASLEEPHMLRRVCVGVIYPLILTLCACARLVPVHAFMQAVHLASLVEPHMLRRFLRDLRPPQQQQQLPVAEVQLQVDCIPQQAEAYKTLLVRNFEVLADPKPPR